MKPKIFSEIGPIERVFVYSPGKEHNLVLPNDIQPFLEDNGSIYSNEDFLLFDDLMDLQIGKKQRLAIVLKRRYWVYYTLQFFSGARRQIFVVFASFMMVEKYDFDVHQITFLLLTNFLINIFMAPLIGRFIEKFGERLSLIVEYFGLMVIFLLYGGLFYFDCSYVVAAVLFIAYHMVFWLAFAM